jgi:thiamine-phosphate pyrophosphorylase
VIALGGVSESNLCRVKNMNFDGTAVLGAIWSKPEQALSNFIKIKTITDQLQ